jgi:hypothetical protein
MKTSVKYLILLLMFGTLLYSCKKEEEEDEIALMFKTSSGYIYSDQTIESGQTLKIGVKAETEKKKDPLIRFSISESKNGGAETTILSKNIETTNFDYDYNFSINDTVSGNKYKYTFVVVNKDGLNKQESITLTVK